MHLRGRIYFAVIILVFMLTAGTTAFILLEGWNLIDSLYMTVIIITTIGFKEVRELSVNGRIFTMVFSLMSYLFLAGVISIMSSVLIDAYFDSHRRRRKMLKKIGQLKKHTIVCGEGNIVRYVCDELISMKQPFAIIGSEEECSRIEEAYGENRAAARLLHVVSGDPSEEENLVRAGIAAAQGVICCMGEDSQNLFIAISARNLNPEARITSYVMNESNVRKFRMAGIQDAVSGDFIIGRRLASSLEDRNIPLFLDQVVRKSTGQGEAAKKSAEADIRFSDVTVPENSFLNGLSLGSSDIARRIGLLVIAVRRTSSDVFLFNPGPDFTISSGDVLIAMGNRQQIENLEDYIGRTSAP